MNKKIFNIAFTMAARRSSRLHISNIERIAFTMAEILLSLTIIGVVAAITLPSLTGNINERTWNTQRKALYARMSQAIPLMGSINSFGLVTADETTDTQTTAAKRFLSEGLSKVLKINNICDHNHLSDCGLPDKFKNLEGTNKTFPKNLKELNYNWYSVSAGSTNNVPGFSTYNTMAAGFETKNGEHIAVFYTPNCSGSNGTIKEGHFYYSVCANFLYDLNGKKGPNTFGKDIGVITVFYPADSVVVSAIPNPKFKLGYASYITSMAYCRDMGQEYKLPNIQELESLLLNHYFVHSNFGQVFITSTLPNGNGEYLVSAYRGVYTYSTRTASTGSTNAVCIKR